MEFNTCVTTSSMVSALVTAGPDLHGRSWCPCGRDAGAGGLPTPSSLGRRAKQTAKPSWEAVAVRSCAGVIRGMRWTLQRSHGSTVARTEERDIAEAAGGWDLNPRRRLVLEHAMASVPGSLDMTSRRRPQREHEWNSHFAKNQRQQCEFR